MRCIIFLSSIFIIQNHVTSIWDKTGEGCFENIHYDALVLTKDLNKPYGLTVDYETEMLFFSYLNYGSRTSATLNLNTHEWKDITDIPLGINTAIDRTNRRVYFGSLSGIYVYNLQDDASSFLAAADKLIWGIQFKNGVLYYTVFGEWKLYERHVASNETKVNDKLKDVKVARFLIDDEGDITFEYKHELFILRNGATKIEKYEKFKSSKYIRLLTLEHTGRMYVCFNDGGFRVDKSSMKLERVLYTGNAYGLAFSNNSYMIYSNSQTIFKLIPHNTVQCQTYNETSLENDAGLSISSDFGVKSSEFDESTTRQNLSTPVIESSSTRIEDLTESIKIDDNISIPESKTTNK